MIAAAGADDLEYVGAAALEAAVTMRTGWRGGTAPLPWPG